jgi:hypothetical protein
MGVTAMNTFNIGTSLTDSNVTTANELWAYLYKQEQTPEAVVVPKGQAAASATVVQGADMTADSGLLNEAEFLGVTAGGEGAKDDGEKDGAGSSDSERNRYTFAKMHYQRMRYDTGSYIDTSAFAVLAGLAQKNQTKHGEFILGGFIESGWGSYDTYNSFPGYADICGSGDANYYGVGLAFRMDYNGNSNGHFYNEGALRYGRAKNDFDTGLLDDHGVSAKYDTSAPYYGAHFTVGYLKNLQNDAELDMYARMLWTRLEGDDVTMSTGDPVTFDDTDSFRWRIGLRYFAPQRGNGKFYFGAAYEYEHDAISASNAHGFDIEAPSMDGGTAIAEIGYAYRKYLSPFSANFNLTGFAGKRDGFATRIDLNWDL